MAYYHTLWSLDILFVKQRYCVCFGTKQIFNHEYIIVLVFYGLAEIGILKHNVGFVSFFR